MPVSTLYLRASDVSHFPPCVYSEAFSDEDDADSDDDEDLFSDERFSGSDDEESDVETQKVTEAARQQAMNNLVPALPASEYGQMPASFNTQRVAKPTILTEQIEAGPLKADTGATDTGAGESSPPVRARLIRPPLLPRDKYEGVDSDDESSSSDPLAGGDDEDSDSEEDRPQVVGEIEVDMNEEEAEFLEFSRQTLGISDEMWDGIIKERQGRGGVSRRGLRYMNGWLTMASSVCTSERNDREEGDGDTKDNVRATSLRHSPKREPRPGLLRGSYASHGCRAVALATISCWVRAPAPASTADEKG